MASDKIINRRPTKAELERQSDEIAEAAKNEWFNPTKPLRDETEGERFKRIVKQAITAALAAMPGEVDSLRSKPDFHSDPVEQLAFELAFELEEADLKPDDLVTVNREKLRAIAKRILSRLTPAPVSVERVDWRKVLLDDEPTEEMRHYAHTAYAASGDLMDACRAFVRAAPLTSSAIGAEDEPR